MSGQLKFIIILISPKDVYMLNKKKDSLFSPSLLKSYILKTFKVTGCVQDCKNYLALCSRYDLDRYASLATNNSYIAFIRTNI